jgi:hypothetical protein
LLRKGIERIQCGEKDGDICCEDDCPETGDTSAGDLTRMPRLQKKASKLQRFNVQRSTGELGLFRCRCSPVPLTDVVGGSGSGKSTCHPGLGRKSSAAPWLPSYHGNLGDPLGNSASKYLSPASYGARQETFSTNLSTSSPPKPVQG